VVVDDAFLMVEDGEDELSVGDADILQNYCGSLTDSVLASKR